MRNVSILSRMHVSLRIRLALLVTLTLLVVPLTAHRADAAYAMQIRKVYWDSPGSDTGTNSSLNAEYVVLKNTGASRVTLTGWTLRDKSNHVYKFGTFSLAAGATVTVHTGKGTNTAAHRYWGSTSYIWNNTGDTATLKTSAGAARDSCTWGSAGDWKYC